jgi:hypothetical protein
MTEPHSEVARLSQLAEQAAASQTDLIAALAKAIKGSAAAEVDPYVLIGVLIEGAAHILVNNIPVEKRAEVGQAMAHLLLDRMGAHGVA